MISKIELKEISNDFIKTFIKIDFLNQTIIVIKNEVIINQGQLHVDVEKLTNLVKNYVTYWDDEYTNNMIIDGMRSELNIYTDNEIIKYNFKNKYPYNYGEFVKIFQEMVGII